MAYWNEKVALVTGASRGLGLSIARQLASQGATVVMVARDEEALTAAAASLNSLPGQTVPLAADVTSDDDVKRLELEMESRFGGLDLLVNNVGISSRGKLLETQLADFRRQWELNVMAAIRCVQAFAPLLIRRQGHIINIGSLASKSAIRFIGPYATTKFALAGFTQQLRLELADDGVHVMLVCPGPIAREDAGTRYDHQMGKLPDEAQKPGAGVKLKAIDPDQLAVSILKGCEGRKHDLVVPWKARILFAISQISPRWGDWLQAKFSSKNSNG
ncbi:SDR family oxidoreductase [Blastopirellula sp. JC732]|uniref:SDR family oxidoreductase n=1 Tax=Blastopirellula sediminis TaxID=2894196 RepID=A0A9X1MTN8_9BACT|nr:SDR family oxidoreductase [Blastopirellula sediminis]MCC9605301.1 SDR family oxidoreductase [Blastopirellula sediminis]MCC9631399.1 SDR family oxidoreductase [Blastopirellula sediminis]